jgi:hypothetical protein
MSKRAGFLIGIEKEKVKKTCFFAVGPNSTPLANTKKAAKPLKSRRDQD